MGMNNKIKFILYNAQQSASCHQRYLKSLETYYNQISSEAFIEDFLQFLRHIFHKDITARNPYVERTLEFLAQFISFVTKSRENDTNISVDEDSPSHPFLTQVVIETLTFQDLIYEQTRYYSCRFITLILQHVGNETHLDNFMCDAIQDAMLQRIMDPKTSIRLQAIMALVRLQEPSNAECPVIQAYISLLVDTNPMIRKEVVKRIAPNSLTISKICERIRDVDSNVRMAAYSRCADIGPRLFKIITRQQILQCGFKDDNKQVRTIFLENLLPKWLIAYNNNFLDFLSGLKLDADEDDIINTQEVSKQVMEVFFSNSTIKEIIGFLPINNEKLVSLDDLSSEVVTYWSIVTKFLRNSDETEEYLSSVLPELTPFCHYIQRIIESKTNKTLEEWEYIEYQYMLYNLLDMAEHYDFSDEIGRKTFYKLITSILQNYKLQFKLAKKIVGVVDKLISNVDMLTHEICQIISDIREPLVEKPAVLCQSTNRNFQVAELKVKINILQGEIEDALDNQDFQKASVIQNQIVEHKGKLDEIQKQSQIVKVKISKDDPETICRCLDLLGALMELPSVNVLSPSLATCKTEFLLPLLSSNNVEINWRVLKCIALYCILDKNITEEHAKVLCIPIITYRAIPNYNKFALMQSVAAICDLLRVYGPKLFSSEKDTNNSTSSVHNATRRKLYRNEAMDDVTVMDHGSLNVEIIIEIVLDMLDDENEDIRETAIIAISKLVLNEFPVNSSLICRIILKWFNPLEKAIDKTQQKLGFLISNYTKLIKGAKEVIQKAVIPIISSITCAPRTSPLVDVDIDNVLQFLSAITNSNDTTDIVNIHTNLAYTLCYSIINKPEDQSVPYLTKMLLYLEIPPESTVAIKELITQMELLLEDKENGIDKGPRKYLKKFIEKLGVTATDKCTTENINKGEQAVANGHKIDDQNLLAESNSIQEASERAQEIEQMKGTNINADAHKNDYNTNNINNQNDKLTTININNYETINGSTYSSQGRRSKRLKVHCSKFITNCDQTVSVSTHSKEVADNETVLNIDDSDKINFLQKNVENGSLLSTQLQNKHHEVYTRGKIIKKKNKINKNKLGQKRDNKSENKRKVSSVVRKETNTNKNEKMFQSAKRTKSGIQKRQSDSKKDYIKKCDTKNKNDLADIEGDSTTDIEEDSQKMLRRSKRQKIQLLKSTDTREENTSKDNRNRKESNINTNNCKSNTLTNNSSDLKNHGTNRKKSRRNLQNSITSEETVLHTIIEHSQ